MKKLENILKVSGYVCGSAEIRQFTNSAVARFSLAISRQEKNGEEATRVTSYLPFECWRKESNSETFDLLTKGKFVTVEAFMKPSEYVDREDKKRNQLVFVATKVYPVEEQESKG